MPVEQDMPQAPVPPETADLDTRFQSFLEGFRADALKAGIIAETYERAVTGLTPNLRVLALNENQPEFVSPIWEYLAGAITEARVTKGRDLITANASLFDRLEAAYGVPRATLVAIWGLETGYGQNEGTYNLFQALATLGFEGPRMDYGRRQFLAALKIAEAEHLDPQTMTGSWAGAVGHTQFVPSTFLAYATDGDGDGKRDLWNSPADALASAANLLKASGWRAEANWGEEVQLPAGFAFEQADLDIRKPESEWAALGVRKIGGEALGEAADEAAIFLPAGAHGPAFLVRENFNVILKYNQASAYALAVGLLSNRLAGMSGVIAAWPLDEAPLTQDQRVAVQNGLEALGFMTGGADGVLGRRTHAAIRDYQKARGLDADGFATAELLTRILNEQSAAGATSAEKVP